jgi:hypothetical protein
METALPKYKKLYCTEHSYSLVNWYRATQKKRELLKNPTKNEEMQQQKIY